jgi:hypothetical protein
MVCLSVVLSPTRRSSRRSKVTESLLGHRQRLAKLSKIDPNGAMPRPLGPFHPARVGPLRVLAGLSESIYLRGVVFRKSPVSVAPHSVAASPRPVW